MIVKNLLNAVCKIRRIAFMTLLAGSLLSMSAAAQPVSGAQQQRQSNELRDGQHDFDFNLGTWKTHIHRLLHPLTGSNDWVDLDGTVHVRKVWNGRAQLEEIEADGSTGHLEGLTLFLYNPQAHQWGQYFVDSAVGVVNQPQIGEFKDGRGELFDQESFNGRTILVRFVWSDITPDSHHVEQSFSDDGGKTWEPNFVATLTREKETSTDEMSPRLTQVHPTARTILTLILACGRPISGACKTFSPVHTGGPNTTALLKSAKYGEAGRASSSSKLMDRRGTSKALVRGSSTHNRINGA